MNECFLDSCYYPKSPVFCIFDHRHFDSCEVVFSIILICIFRVIKDVEHFLKCLCAFEILPVRIHCLLLYQIFPLCNCVFWRLAFMFFIHFRPGFWQMWGCWMHFTILQLSFCLIDSILCLREAFNFQELLFIDVACSVCATGDNLFQAISHCFSYKED